MCVALTGYTVSSQLRGWKLRFKYSMGIAHSVAIVCFCLVSSQRTFWTVEPNHSSFRIGDYSAMFDLFGVVIICKIIFSA